MTNICFQPSKKSSNNPCTVKKRLENESYWLCTEGMSALEDVKFLAFQMPSLQTLGDVILLGSFLLDVHPQKELHAYTT